MIILVAATVIVITIAIMAFSAYVGYRLVTPPRVVGQWTPRDLGHDYEEVWIRNREGLRLHAWWINRGSDKTVLPLHGYTVSKWEEIYMKPIMKILLDAGYNVLAFDFRAHGKSEGKRTTVGDRELIDLMSAIDWLLSNHPESARKIGLIGYSMGGIVTISALAEDDRVICGIADSPPIDMDKTAARGLRYFANLPQWLYPIIKPWVTAISGGRVFNIMRCADKVKKPLLLIAGSKDPLVMPEEIKEFAKRNEKVNPHVQLWVTEAEHVRTINLLPEEYKQKILEFFQEYLGN